MANTENLPDQLLGDSETFLTPYDAGRMALQAACRDGMAVDMNLSMHRLPGGAFVRIHTYLQQVDITADEKSYKFSAIPSGPRDVLKQRDTGDETLHSDTLRSVLAATDDPSTQPYPDRLIPVAGNRLPTVYLSVEPRSALSMFILLAATSLQYVQDEEPSAYGPDLTKCVSIMLSTENGQFTASGGKLSCWTVNDSSSKTRNSHRFSFKAEPLVPPAAAVTTSILTEHIRSDKGRLRSTTRFLQHNGANGYMLAPSIINPSFCTFSNGDYASLRRTLQEGTGPLKPIVHNKYHK